MGWGHHYRTEEVYRFQRVQEQGNYLLVWVYRSQLAWEGKVASRIQLGSGYQRELAHPTDSGSGNYLWELAPHFQWGREAKKVHQIHLDVGDESDEVCGDGGAACQRQRQRHSPYRDHLSTKLSREYKRLTKRMQM